MAKFLGKKVNSALGILLIISVFLAAVLVISLKYV